MRAIIEDENADDGVKLRVSYIEIFQTLNVANENFNPAVLLSTPQPEPEAK